MNRSLTLALAPLWLAATAQAANTAPTVVIQSAAMRGATGLMDVVFRVNDPNDATVKTRALAFIDGQRSFAKLIKPTTFAEGTASKIGDAIATNTDHTLTWNVATDWNIDLGQIKFEILAMDGRGLLPLDWVTIPAANGQPELTISKNAPTDEEVLNALFWQYASGDPGLTLENGVLRGNAESGLYSGLRFLGGSGETLNEDSVHPYCATYLLRAMNLAPASGSSLRQATASRAEIHDTDRWHALNEPYALSEILVAWGGPSHTYTPIGIIGFKKFAAGPGHQLYLMNDGTVIAKNTGSQPDVPPGLSNVTSIAAGSAYNLALKDDGTVVAWGENSFATILPEDLSSVRAIAAGTNHGLALKNDGTVVAWGYNSSGQRTVPVGLSGVAAIAAGSEHSLALKSNGTVVAWGANSWGQSSVPVGLSGVTAISAGYDHNLAVKGDGTVVAWGKNSNGQCTIPVGLSGVVSVAAGYEHSLALKADGTVAAWGWNFYGQATAPLFLTGVTAIGAGYHSSFAFKKAP
jgi:hypothetical protein